MTAKPAEHTYEGVLAKIFEYLEEHRIDRPTAQITAQSRLLGDLGLDSVQSYELVADLEDHFDITMPLDLFERATTIEDVAHAVLRQISAESGGAGAP